MTRRGLRPSSTRPQGDFRAKPLTEHIEVGTEITEVQRAAANGAARATTRTLDVSGLGGSKRDKDHISCLVAECYPKPVLVFCPTKRNW